MATTALLSQVPTQSPLKQVNASRTKPVALFDSQWAELTANPSLLASKSNIQITSYFQDLFCLTPNAAVLAAALDKLTTDQLTRQFGVRCGCPSVAADDGRGVIPVLTVECLSTVDRAALLYSLQMLSKYSKRLIAKISAAPTWSRSAEQTISCQRGSGLTLFPVAEPNPIPAQYPLPILREDVLPAYGAPCRLARARRRRLHRKRAPALARSATHPFAPPSQPRPAARKTNPR